MFVILRYTCRLHREIFEHLVYVFKQVLQDIAKVNVLKTCMTSITNHINKSKKDSNDQETIQSSTTPDTGNHMGK